MIPFNQGYLDSLCGVYSIVNADKIINKASPQESQGLFNNIISYLSKKRILKQVIIGGMIHRQFSGIMTNVVGNKIPLQITNKRGFINLDSWWEDAKEFISKPERALILSFEEEYGHLTAVYKITDKFMYLFDSSDGDSKIHKNLCGIVGEDGRYIIYPSQCWYLGKE